MKQLKLLLLAVIGLLYSVSMSAYDFKVDGIYYNKTSATDKTVEVTHGTNFRGSYSGAINIPNTVNYLGEIYTVTCIGVQAFSSCSGLTSVKIGNSVTSSELGAFEGCTGLTSIVIPIRVTSIEAWAFEDCTGLTSIVIPNRVTYIGAEAFKGCTGLTSVEIGNSVNSIGTDAFLDCSGLTSVHITDVSSWCKINFSNIFSSPMYYARNLYLNGEIVTNLVIPNRVTSIGEWAFNCCTSLKSVVIPNSVTSIGKHAFYFCTRLKSVMIPNSVTSIGNKAFEGCTSLNSVELNTDTVYSWFSEFESLSTLILGDKVKTIGNYAFTGCSGLTSVIIPNNLTNIEIGSFSGCSGLTTVEIGNSVTNIGEDAFSYCTGLNSVVIPNSVTSIGKTAFEGCTSLNSVELNTETVYSWFSEIESLSTLILGDKVKTINTGAFENCSGLTSVVIGRSVTSIGINAFSNCSNLTSIKLNIETIDSWFKGIKSLSTIVLGDNVKNINKGAFEDCSGLTSLTIGNNVFSIGNSAFAGCSGLTSITIPNSVTNIGEFAFYYCTGLNTITIGNSVSDIGMSAFRGCSNLTSLDIPQSVTSIGDLAFADCLGLTSVTSYIPANNLFPIGSNVFESVNKTDCTLNVPFGAKKKYSSTTGWNEFKNIIELHFDGESVQIDEQGVMYILNTDTDAFEVVSCTNDLSTDIVLPATIDGLPVKIITAEVFKETNVQSIVIPATIQEVGDDAFVGCTELRWVDWQAQAQVRAECFDAPEVHGNMLLFCYGEQAPNYAGNVVVNGKAKEIALMDARPYASPYDYEAENISFTKTFTKETMIGTGAGWEGIVVPFDVERIVFGDKVIAPFGATGQYNDIPCWLAQMKDENFVMTNAIRADEAYIMAVPNSEAYDDDYNVEGDVRFEATNAVVKATANSATAPANEHALVGTYEPVEIDADVFALNDDGYWNEYEGLMAPGSIFVHGLRDVRPFEAYVRSTKALQMACLKIGSVLPTHITSVQSGKTDAEAWYTLQGKRLNTKPVQTGFYLHGGKLEFVRQQ